MVISDLEDSEDYQAFEEAVTAGYDAQLAVQRELVLRLASILWRLRRATGIETALFESVATEPEKPKRSHAKPMLVDGRTGSQLHQLSLGAARQPAAWAKTETDRNFKKHISETASCTWQRCRLFLWIVSAATSTRCVAPSTPDRWSRCPAYSTLRPVGLSAFVPYEPRLRDGFDRVVPRNCSVKESAACIFQLDSRPQGVLSR